MRGGHAIQLLRTGWIMMSAVSKLIIIVTPRRWRSEDDQARRGNFLDRIEQPCAARLTRTDERLTSLRLRGRLLSLRFFHRQFFTIAPILERTVVEMCFIAKVTGNEIQQAGLLADVAISRHARSEERRV